MNKLVEHYKSLLSEVKTEAELVATLATSGITPQLQAQHPELFPDKIPGKDKKSTKLIGVERAKKIAPEILAHQRARLKKIAGMSGAKIAISRLPIKDPKTEKTIRPPLIPAENAPERIQALSTAVNLSNLQNVGGELKATFTQDKSNPQFTPIPRLVGEPAKKGESEINISMQDFPSTPLSVGGITPEAQKAAADKAENLRGSAIQQRRQTKVRRAASTAAAARERARISAALQAKKITGFI
jgi:hypothetical protein